jgi:hypothetical protein
VNNLRSIINEKLKMKNGKYFGFSLHNSGKSRTVASKIQKQTYASLFAA